MKKIVIIGASGHGKVVADIAKLNGYQDISFLDDNKNLLTCGSYPVIGSIEIIDQIEGNVIVAIGDSRIREKILESIPEDRITTLIHPDAVISEDVAIGKGTVIMAGVVVNPGVSIGKGCIVNTSSSIDHDCTIEDYVHVSVGSHLAGSVIVGSHTWVGIGAVIRNNIKVGPGCLIGAGAIVVKEIKEPGTYVGVPARRIKLEQKEQFLAGGGVPKSK